MYIISLCAAVLKHRWALARSKPGTVVFFVLFSCFLVFALQNDKQKSLDWACVLQGRSFKRSAAGNTEGSGTIKDKRRNSTAKINHKFDDLMILCCFLCDEAYQEKNSWFVKSQESRRSEHRRLWSETERNCTGKHEVQFRPYYTCTLERHPGPEKPKHNHVSILFFFFFN